MGMTVARPAIAAVSAGVSYSSTTNGRTSPSLNAAWNSERWALAASTGGVQTTIYYQSDYTLKILRFGEVGELWWGKVRAGFGGGFYFGERGYRTSTTSNIEKVSDWTVGPAFRVEWDLLGPSFTFIESLYGLRSFQMAILLSYQDLSHWGLGLRW